MTYKGSTRSRESSIVQTESSRHFHLVHHRREFARNLHSRLDSIDRHEENAEQCGCRTGCHGLEAYIQVLGRLEPIECCQDTRICRCITKTTQRTLNQSRQYTTIKAGNTTVGIERSEGSGEACSIAVLVVDLQKKTCTNKQKKEIQKQ